MGAIESSCELEVAPFRVNLDTRSRLATCIRPIEVDLEVGHVKCEVSANFAHIFLNRAKKVLLACLLHVRLLLFGVDADDGHGGSCVNCTVFQIRHNLYVMVDCRQEKDVELTILCYG